MRKPGDASVRESSPPKECSLKHFGSLLGNAQLTAYDVFETRRYWKTRGLAIVLTFSVGCLLVIALGLLHK